jgi:hypothetical protein
MFVYLGIDFEIVNQHALKDAHADVFKRVKERVRAHFNVFNPEDSYRRKPDKYISLARTLRATNLTASPQEIKTACFAVVEAVNSFFQEVILQHLPPEPLYLAAKNI